MMNQNNCQKYHFINSYAYKNKHVTITEKLANVGYNLGSCNMLQVIQNKGSQRINIYYLRKHKQRLRLNKPLTFLVQGSCQISSFFQNLHEKRTTFSLDFVSHLSISTIFFKACTSCGI